MLSPNIIHLVVAAKARKLTADYRTPITDTIGPFCAGMNTNMN